MYCAPAKTTMTGQATPATWELIKPTSRNRNVRPNRMRKRPGILLQGQHFLPSDGVQHSGVVMADSFFDDYLTHFETNLVISNMLTDFLPPNTA
jgi:hypothetical protein